MYPVAFINDVQAALIEESANYKGVNNLVVIMIGTGIGMSMIVDGQECLGSSGFTGELGYSVVQSKKGPTFLDNVAAGAGILNQYGGSAQELKLALENSDIKAEKIIDLAASNMGIGIISVISLLNPEVIVVGGGTLTYKNYFDLMLKSVDNNCLKILRDATQIVKSTTPGYTVVYGALKRAMELV